MANLKTFSVLINWADNTDQGDFGEVVRARDEWHAERIVRARMCWTHWRDHRQKGESRRESLSSYHDGHGEYFGSVVECHEGAIWRAADLEKVLRDLLAYEDDRPAPGTRGAEVYAAAEKLLAEIDGV